MNLADARILHVSPAMTVIISLLSNFAFFNVEFAHSFLIMLEFTVAQFMYWTLFWLWRKLLRSRSELGGRLPGLSNLCRKSSPLSLLQTSVPSQLSRSSRGSWSE